MVSDHWEVRLPENSSGVKPQGQSGVEDTPSPRASYSNLGSESPQLSEGSCFWTETFPVQFLISTFSIFEEGQMISLLSKSHYKKYKLYIPGIVLSSSWRFCSFFWYFKEVGEKGSWQLVHMPLFGSSPLTSLSPLTKCLFFSRYINQTYHFFYATQANYEILPRSAHQFSVSSSLNKHTPRNSV